MTESERKELEHLLDEYAQAASAHGKATELADSRLANKAADEIAHLYRRIREIGTEAQQALLLFLDNLDPSVRLWAGGHALEFAPAEGERVLEALARQPYGLLSFDAQVTLSEWREGRLKFP